MLCCVSVQVGEGFSGPALRRLLGSANVSSIAELNSQIDKLTADVNK
jgi:hypothetical protein